jgi:methylenetetrahydrofolate dehydrogenase (NADP+) / methenyltetrahydrofolate cyclohydrolase
MIHDNLPLKHNFQNFLASQIASLSSQPVLDIIQIGDNLASSKYIQVKRQVAEKIGLIVNLHQLGLETEPKAGYRLLEQARNNNHGLIVQLPVPSNFRPLVESIAPKMDVDLLGVEAFRLWEKGFLPPTIGAIDLTLKDILRARNLKVGSSADASQFEQMNFELSDDFDRIWLEKTLDLNGLIVVVIGRGKLVGAPAIRYFLDRGATVIAIEKTTPNPQFLAKQADILISATGQKNLLDREWVKPGAIVIDASTSESDGSLVGDANKQTLPENIILSPSPGGIGGLTVLYLFYNLIRLVAKSE